MMVRTIRNIAICLAGVLLVGCSDSPTTDSEAFNPAGQSNLDVNVASLVLNEMPEGEASTPTEIMDLGGEETPVILAGRIDAGSMDPFQPGEMTFMISELPDKSHAEGDPEHADNCPFCKHKLEKAPKAIVQFRGADGNVLAGDVQQSLSLQKGDVVYVTGTAQYNPALNTVMVNAKGIFRTPRR